MSFSFKKWRSFINESKLRVFDFDDTLVKTASKVKVTYPDGTTEDLSSEEYAKQGEALQNKYDFSEFKKVISPQEIEKVTNILRNVVNADPGGREIVILSARQPAAEAAIKKYLEEIGIDTSKIDIVLVGDAHPLAKSDWIENKIKEGANDILFLDDAGKNVQAVLDLKKEYPHVKIDARQVKYAGELPEKDLTKQVDPEVVDMIVNSVELPVRAMYLFGTFAAPPEEQKRGEHGHSEEEDKDIWVRLSSKYDHAAMSEIRSHWESSPQYKKLRQMGYDVRLASNDEAVTTPNIPLTKDLL